MRCPRIAVLLKQTSGSTTIRSSSSSDVLAHSGLRVDDRKYGFFDLPDGTSRPTSNAAVLLRRLCELRLSPRDHGCSAGRLRSVGAGVAAVVESRELGNVFEHCPGD